MLTAAKGSGGLGHRIRRNEVKKQSVNGALKRGCVDQGLFSSIGFLVVSVVLVVLLFSSKCFNRLSFARALFKCSSHGAHGFCGSRGSSVRSEAPRSQTPPS